MSIPSHVAIIPDGNRRWATEKGLPSFQGHIKGFNAAIQIGRKARALGVKILTIWGFSTENWDRPEEEVSRLMKLYETWISKSLKEAIVEEIRIVHLGRKDRLPNTLKKKIREAEEKTKKFKKYYFAIALDYGGRDEILRVMKKVQSSTPIKSGSKFKVQNERDFKKLLDTSVLPSPNPDLIIRTSGEHRLSGFMPWQSAYSELIFLDEKFPEFTPKLFEWCIEEYSRRERRFGK